MASQLTVNYNRLKLLCILEGAGAVVLRFVLRHGTSHPRPPISLLDYLNNLDPQTSTANFTTLSGGNKSKLFNTTEKDNIRNDHLWDSFDVSMLFKAIKFACENVAGINDIAAWGDHDRIEGLITKIKDVRNIVVHERPPLSDTEFYGKVWEMKDLFRKTLQKTRDRYNVPVQEITQEEARLDIMIQDISKCFTIEEILRLDVIKQLSMFKSMFETHLHDIYDTRRSFDPLSFLSESPQSRLDVRDLFNKIIIKQHPEDFDLEYLDILTYTQSLGTQHAQGTNPTQPQQSPQLLLLTGVAGSGKTTLITYILSEWLEEKNARSIKLLEKYDLVLHIMCRDKNCHTLEDFLEKINSQAAVFRPITMTLLKRCNLLFLVDGLDESSTSSKALLKDILNIQKLVPQTSIICTSRPEAVVDFLTKEVPDQYVKGRGELKGIAESDRTRFVLNYYRHLSPRPHNEDRLKEVMDRVGWQEHFTLPLNLLFLAALFTDKPEKVNVKTQTGLYISVHEWSIHKLQSRLAGHPGQASRTERDMDVKEIVDVIDKMSLLGLVENRLNLSEDEMRQLRESCKKVNLAMEEIIGAFFSSRQTVTNRTLKISYYAPHKGIQEFRGARYIVSQISDQTRIRQLLQKPSSTQLVNLRNLLLHVAGLLSQENQPSPTAIKEVVDLLAESRMKKCDDWLSLLGDADLNPYTVNCIAKHIKPRGWKKLFTSMWRNNEEVVTIFDSRVESGRALLPLIPSKRVSLALRRRQPDVHQLICQHHTYIGLSLRHHYKHPNNNGVSDSLLNAMPRSHLEWFGGHLSGDGIKLLSEFPLLDDLRLAVQDDQDLHSVVSAIIQVLPSLHSLGWLALHVPVPAIPIHNINTRLPDFHHPPHNGGGGLMLVLSGVDDTLLDTVCYISVMLQPKETRYCSIRFPNSCIRSMTGDKWRELLHGMYNAGVRVQGGVHVPETCPITEEEEKELNTLVNINMEGRGGFKRCGEDLLWGV